MQLVRSFLARLALLAFSSLVALFVAELAIRLLYPQPLSVVTPGLYAPDPPRRFMLRPGHEGRISNLTEFDTRVEIGAHGLREESLPDKDRPSVLVMGDSYIFGWGVERGESLPSLLDARWPDRKFVNAGIPGFGLPDQVDWLEAHGLDLEPTSLVLAVFLGNDLLDATSEYRKVSIDQGLVSEEGASTGLRAWAFNELHLLRLVKRALPARLQLAVRERLGLPLPRALVYLRDAMGIYAVEPTPLIREGREATREAMSRLAGIAEENGLEVAIILIPGPLLVDDHYWGVAQEQLAEVGSTYDREMPARFFTELAGQWSFPLLDLTPQLRKAFLESSTGGPAIYFRHDPHWTTEGHRLAARETAEFLAATGLLAPSSAQLETPLP